MEPATTNRSVPTSFAEGAGFVRRLAIQSGLTPEQADDVCFLTFQQAVLDPRTQDMSVNGDAGWLLRTAIEKCAVVRCLAWQQEGRAPRHFDGLRAVSS
jgi:hypothetical protein